MIEHATLADWLMRLKLTAIRDQFDNLIDEAARREMPLREAQDLFDIGEEGGAVHGAVENQGRRQARASQGGDEGGRLPVPERRAGQQTLAARRATIKPGHLGAGAGLVDEDELVRINEGLCRPPDPTPGGDVRPLLLAGAQRFFYKTAPAGQPRSRSRHC